MNRLAGETSPYLRQHRDNPVDWYPWGAEAFAEAQDTDRPLLVSVGYSACHWCHVMAHECFEDDEVAAVMNRLFVNVKVDREERPDVDALYMEAVQAMTGRGGWPMTVFLTPTGHPFYGGTYFPKPQFLALMQAMDAAWRDKREDVTKNVEALTKALSRSAAVNPATAVPGVELLNTALQQLGSSFDQRWGGFGSAPKFPQTATIELALRAYVANPHDAAATVATTSLDAMAAGGIYDHLGGGFARYSVDERWLVPHFEKMLYDQAQLGRVYLHAYQVFGHERWRQVVEETVGYVLRDLAVEGGGWASAEDADSPDEHGHSHEGLFYTWTPDEMRAVLGDELAETAMEWWEVSPEGNFEGRTILSRLSQRDDLIRPPEVERARAQLFEARERRPRPGLDDKVLTEWNAMMLATLAEAAAALQRDDWLAAALANGEFLLRELRRDDGRWHRSWQVAGTPRARHDALAADHATLVDAFTRLGEASGQARWIDAARATADVMLDHFWDVARGGLFTTADDAEALIVRQKELLDGATPSANSTAALALLRLAALTGEMRYANQAEQILKLLGQVMPNALSGFSNALAAVDLLRTGISEIAIVGDRPDLLDVVRSRYRPSVVVAWGEPYESPLWTDRREGYAYVCRSFVCSAPTDDPATLATQLDG